MMVSRWTVDYGDGPHPVILPHAWGQDVSVDWEGPAIYRTEVDVPRGGGTLRFSGVSYAATVFVDDVERIHHEGIWDAFDVEVPGGKIRLEVRVVKNGGPTYPVDTMASGGLPDLFQTFGGIYREVELLETTKPLVRPPSAKPTLPYVRAIVHRGWYPDLGCPSPDESTILKEIREIKALGFNVIKFAGWVPSHRYLELLQNDGMFGWLELPLGRIAEERLDDAFDEIEGVVLQYRHHPAVVAWTLGSREWSSGGLETRRHMVEMVKALTASDWVSDHPLQPSLTHPDAEAIGSFIEIQEPSRVGSNAEFLDGLRPGAWEASPIVVGDLASGPAHRDLSRMGDELPFWASALSELGGRNGRVWAASVEESRFANEPTRSGHKGLMASSHGKQAFARKSIVEAARARAGWIGGYALADLSDTPTSSAGLFDDWGRPRLSAEESARWNGPSCLFLLPKRVLREDGYRESDPFNHFAGELRLGVGLHSESSLEGTLRWRIVDLQGRTRARGAGSKRHVVGAQQVGEVLWPDATPGDYRLEVGFADAENVWELWVVERAASEDRASVESPQEVLVLEDHDEGVLKRSFWFGSALEFRNDAFWSRVPLKDRWPRLNGIASDRALDPVWLRERFGDYEVLLNRVDVQSYQEPDLPLLVRAGGRFVTCLDLASVDEAPAGAEMLRCLNAESARP